MDIRNFETYIDLQIEHQKDVDNFPMVWIFGTKTDKEILECISKIGAKSLNDCVENGAGGLILKSDKQKYLDMFKIHELERKAFAESENNLYKMILSEMYNHEYGYTRDPYDTLIALGKSILDLETDKKFNRAWCKAEEECYRNFDEE